jgi:hypothetical protein
MQPSQALIPEKKVQQRLRRFIRQPERVANRQVTSKALEAIAIIERYRFIPTSLLVRLMSGEITNNYLHLRNLFHKGLVNRFAVPRYGVPGEFIYYLDSASSLSLLVEEGLLANLSDEARGRKEEIIRYNREKNYAGLYRDPDAAGKLLYIRHELMIARLHWMVESACKKLAGNVVLEQWAQGSELWSRIEVPKARPVRKDEVTGRIVWEDQDRMETLPHRPDAFFTLYFPNNPEGKQRSHFLYEADRGTENTTRFKLKLRSHYAFIVRSNRQRLAPYNVHSIRAVLIESTDQHWASQLRECAKENIVSPRPSPLFWFTTSELFTRPADSPNNGKRPTALYLEKPEIIFKRIWASPVDDKLLNLAD